jgi:environmental stress-induced protein Ves
MRRILGPEDFRQMPWANGKGITTELAREDREGRMLWRLSRASVVEDGPFSIFPGIERNLTVLTGPGFSLTGDGISLEARAYSPVAFLGDVPVAASGVAAPSDDFNVMTDRSLPRPTVEVVAGRRLLDPDTGILAVYWPEFARLLLTDEAVEVAELPAIAVWLAIS